MSERDLTETPERTQAHYEARRDFELRPDDDPATGCPFDVGFIAGWNAELAAANDSFVETQVIFAAARTIRFTFDPHDNVFIDVYRHEKTSILHWRDRDGDWLNDPTNDTDWKWPRHWKRFDTPMAAFAYLKTLTHVESAGVNSSTVAEPVVCECGKSTWIERLNRPDYCSGCGNYRPAKAAETKGGNDDKD